ncbi:hypothetical protein [uncultured Psychrobacter sp.]|uniref:hypothetical protein n=1 Tax=uncultured Psychrobacter sp. TaxID=259303 RepID=UPI0030D82C94
MFILSSEEKALIDDALYKTLNVPNINESEEVEFIDGTEEMGDSISGRLLLTSAVLDKEVADNIIAELNLPETSLIRIEVETALLVMDVEEDENTGSMLLIDEDTIKYIIKSDAENLCVLSKPNNANSEEDYDSRHWDRHAIPAPFACKSIIEYLNSGLNDDVTLPLINAFLDYHNY